MAFPKLTNQRYPRRQWALVGFPGSGKSTFVAAMRQPGLIIDADHRFAEIIRTHGGNFFGLSENPADNIDARNIAHLLKEGMSGSGVQTIVVDSLTAIITPLVMEAMLANKAKENTNKVAAFTDKALAMRTLQDAVTGYGTDTLWIYHLQEGRDQNAQKQVTTSISPVELARLRRSLNLELRMIRNGNKFGIRVEWAREGRSGMELWDQTGCWKGMPEAIEAAVYDNVTTDDLRKLQQRTHFSGVADALAWGCAFGIFNDEVHAKNAYEQLKEAHHPQKPQEMWDLWIDEVQRRVHEQKPNEQQELTY